MKDKRPSVSILLIGLMLIVISGLLIHRGLLRAQDYKLEQISENQTQMFEADAQQAQLAKELKIKDTDAYVSAIAKELYGYLLPGEIKFVVLNPEVLYDVPKSGTVEIAIP